MDLLIDDPKSEQQFRQILTRIRLAKSGETVELMKNHGLNYKVNWGASIISLRDIASQYEPNHLLALKLWNKQWRETMILAAMLDVPKEVTEEQMDYWTKSLETTEIAETLNTFLWAKTKFAFIKSLEWCRGKKHLVRFTGTPSRTCSASRTDLRT
jgi:3-methyladenine DNA glycosylase AlkD